jgi:hypothetical protein
VLPVTRPEEPAHQQCTHHLRVCWQAARLAVLLDALDEVAISDSERASVT